MLSLDSVKHVKIECNFQYRPKIYQNVLWKFFCQFQGYFYFLNFNRKLENYANIDAQHLTTCPCVIDTGSQPRDVLFEFHLKFWNTASIGIPVRSLL